GEVTRVSSDIPYNFIVLNNTLYFRSYSLFGSSIKKLNDKAELVISEKGEYLCTDGTNLYFVVNGLTASNSGIYKLNPNSASATLLSTGKAKYLTYNNGYLYFADGSNGWKLSRLSVSGGSRTLVVDEKITCLTVANNTLFFTVDNLLGNYIGNYNLSTNVSRKLTRDAGSNLTVIGNDLYYINVDLISSTLNGKGIYVVDAYPTQDKQAAGVRIIGEENESYSSLTLVGSHSFGFYKVSTQMLCVYDIQNSQEIDVLDGFVAPEVVPLSTGSKLIPYGNVLYYLDLYNDKALFSYDPITKVKSRITSNKVSDFAIIGDDLYYNAVSLGVNNSLYKVSLKNGGVPEKISDYDCNDIVTDGSNLYYVEKNAAGVRTAIHKIDSTSDSIIYSKGAEYLTYYKGYLYFLDGKDLLKISVNDTANVITVKKGNANAFIIHNDVIYFREMHGIAWALKNLSKMNLDGSNETVLMETNTDPLKIVVYENKLYYYSDTTKESGIYCLDLANLTKTPELIVERGSQYFAEEFTILNGNIYFVNYYNNLGDSHLYKVNILTKQIENLDA
ncbi:MAG: DUF5050 domain-containing protein, partial [Anaeroplasmataceae bacterium]|nr:DUF5050 domain-containing protein [Anaeroplasmataceae bacterium]